MTRTLPVWVYFALLASGCTSPTSPSCTEVVYPRVEQRHALMAEGRVAFVSVIIPEMRTEVCE